MTRVLPDPESFKKANNSPIANRCKQQGLILLANCLLAKIKEKDKGATKPGYHPKSDDFFNFYLFGECRAMWFDVANLDDTPMKKRLMVFLTLIDNGISIETALNISGTTKEEILSTDTLLRDKTMRND